MPDSTCIAYGAPSGLAALLACNLLAADTIYVLASRLEPAEPLPVSYDIPRTSSRMYTLYKYIQSRTSARYEVPHPLTTVPRYHRSTRWWIHLGKQGCEAMQQNRFAIPPCWVPGRKRKPAGRMPMSMSNEGGSPGSHSLL